VANGVDLGKPNLDHITRWNKELDEAGINGAVKSPILLPDYSRRD
jgi:hypothetical protein